MQWCIEIKEKRKELLKNNILLKIQVPLHGGTFFIILIKNNDKSILNKQIFNILINNFNN